MSAFITSPTTELPLRGAMTVIRSGLKSTFGRRAAQFLGAAAGAGMLAMPTVAADEFTYPVEGYWLTSGGKSIVEIAPCKAGSHKRLCGTVVWSDSENIDAVGTQVMKSFRLDGNRSGDKWAKGKIAFGGEKGKAGKLALKDDTLKVSVCKGSSRRCKNQSWSRPSATMTAQAGLTKGA